MSSKRGLIIASTLAAIIVAIIAFLKLRSKAQIVDVRWEAKMPKHLDISWYDEEPDCLYKIHWSNQPGIKIDRPTTYRHVTRVTGSLLRDENKNIGRQIIRVLAPYEWCYFVISKGSSRTQEFEANILQDYTFTASNLKAERRSVRGPAPRDQKEEMRGPALRDRLRSDEDLNDDFYESQRAGSLPNSLVTSINLRVLESADSYKIYQYLPDGDVLTSEYGVKGEKSVDVKISMVPDMMVYISFSKDGFEHAPEFLFYSEKIFVSEHKWATRTKLC